MTRTVIAPGVVQIDEPPIASKSSRPLTEERITISEEDLRGSTAGYARLITKYETDPKARARIAPSAYARAKAELIAERQKKDQHNTHGEKTRERVAAMPAKVQPRSAIHFADEITIMGLSAMPVEDDADWDELLDSHYWSRLIVEHGATGYLGMRLHVMKDGNYRGTIEITQIDKDPDGVWDKNRVAVKKIA